ncbi:MAG: hypothetical protein J6K13_02960 [Clostridia bacterium]|nr:hypothetical protein [Clostridia bacterium]
MCKHEKKNLQELDDSELDRVSGGISDVFFLNEERLPLGWYVTCFKCRVAFQVSEGACPKCGGVEVMHGVQTDVVIHPGS